MLQPADLPGAGDALILGIGKAAAPAVARRLAADGYTVVAVGEAGEAGGGVAFHRAAPQAVAEIGDLLADRVPGFQPAAIVFVAEPPPPGGPEDVGVEDMIDALDRTLVTAGQAAKSLFTRTPPARPTRIVLLIDWTATSVPGHTAASAVMGGLLGLARSFALEFAPAGVTANAVVAGPEAGGDPTLDDSDDMWLAKKPTAADVAHAVAFFLDPRSAAITGQVLNVCGGRTAGRVPI